jgi:hypothetical protein
MHWAATEEGKIIHKKELEKQISKNVSEVLNTIAIILSEIYYILLELLKNTMCYGEQVRCQLS